MKKILVALSGGVDSAVAAALLQAEGHTVEGVYMRTWMNEEGSNIFADCPWAQDLEDAQAVASRLGIPFKTLNLIDAYRKHVVEYLVQGYKNGITPNPDIMCNKAIKFGTLVEYALNHGYDGLATGHYCHKEALKEGAFRLHEGADKNKDQSYFLALSPRENLKHAYFPLGALQKPQVRAYAQKIGLPNALKKDSQGICFLGKVNINDFLKQYIPEHPGSIVNQEGKILGEHKGLHNYTLGQRKGMGVPSNADHERYIVIAKDYTRNELIIAFERPDTPGLYCNSINITQINYIATPLKKPTRLLAKPRYRDPSTPITLTPTGRSSAHVCFDSPQRALAPGQVIALYEGDVLLGGGIYTHGLLI